MAFGGLRSSILVACIVVMAGTGFTLCEARSFGMSTLQGGEIPEDLGIQPMEELEISCETDVGAPLNSPNSHPYITVPHFALPPLDSMAPIPTPPYRITTPPYGSITPPPSVPAKTPSPPKHKPSPSPTEFGYSPPGSLRPCSPKLAPSSPKLAPNPPKLALSPPLYSPPVGHPPAPPKAHIYAVWCVAKPTVPDSIIQVAMDYACGAGANCKPIQPNGVCYQPDTLLAHASYAFNSYWQKRKEAGGTCDFGGTAMLVTVDPSYNGCHFDYT